MKNPAHVSPVLCIGWRAEQSTLFPREQSTSETCKTECTFGTVTSKIHRKMLRHSYKLVQMNAECLCIPCLFKWINVDPLYMLCLVQVPWSWDTILYQWGQV